jgi:uncharacterized membrane protein
MNDDVGPTGAPEPEGAGTAPEGAEAGAKEDKIAPDRTGAGGAAHEAGEPGRSGGAHALDLLLEQLTKLERSVPGSLRSLPREAIPAWRRVTEGEPRWQVSLVVLAAIALQLPVPGRLVLLHPSWLLPVLEALLLVGLFVANPRHINRESTILRYLSLTLIALISLANVWSVERLINDIITRSLSGGANTLLIDGGSIWLTNVIAFALWYWEFDRGGPVARAHALKPYPDFQFVQMANPELAPPGWEPMFLDYFYLSFTNAAAFSPTDVMPLSRWAKMLMLVQSVASLVTVALIIARAVNILG